MATTAVSPVPARASEEPSRSSGARARGALARSGAAGWLGLSPFLVFMAVFLIVPIVVNVWVSIHDVDGNLSLDPLLRATQGQYRSAFITTTSLAGVTALIGAGLGLVLAWAMVTSPRPAWLRTFMLSFSTLASQLGGIPLAFAFVALMGTQGYLTLALEALLDWNLTSTFRLSTFWGLAIVYLYFQIPLMAVLVLPSLIGVRREWLESAESMGAGKIRYLVDVLVPILSPSLIGATLLLFANGFSAYATAYALTGGAVNLVPLQVGYLIRGDVMSDPSMGAALVTGMILVVAAAMVLRWLVTRRASRWMS